MKEQLKELNSRFFIFSELLLVEETKMDGLKSRRDATMGEWMDDPDAATTLDLLQEELWISDVKIRAYERELKSLRKQLEKLEEKENVKA